MPLVAMNSMMFAFLLKWFMRLPKVDYFQWQAHWSSCTFMHIAQEYAIKWLAHKLSPLVKITTKKCITELLCGNCNKRGNYKNKCDEGKQSPILVYTHPESSAICHSRLLACTTISTLLKQWCSSAFAVLCTRLSETKDFPTSVIDFFAWFKPPSDLL